jgi:glycogen phosphorylase
MTSSITPFLAKTRIAYFSMELAIRYEIHTYSGGLGVLAGDIARTAADLGMPMVFVLLVNRAGYFRQTINHDRWQVEQPNWWEPSDWCIPLKTTATVEIEGRPVVIRPWLYVQTGVTGHTVPILLLDTDIEQNSAIDRTLTHHLYGGDGAYRLKQEIILGIGGARVLKELGFDIQTWHMNEGHAALLTLDRLAEARAATGGDGLAQARKQCVFTTHTPVPAGQDRFHYDLYTGIAPQLVPLDTVKELAGHDELNMTRLALNLSGYSNAVAERHAETSRKMFPGYQIHAVTNGVHTLTWAHSEMAQLFDKHVPKWRLDPKALADIASVPHEDIWKAHRKAKAQMAELVFGRTGITLDLDKPILGYARRMTPYKRPLLMFSDIERLAAIAQYQPFQIVISGKAHPRDHGGHEAIQRILENAGHLAGRLRVAFVPAYNMMVANAIVAGVDVWVNTPTPPLEASGTSGMKAALNGVPNFSVLDGWWVEGCQEGLNGWAIGADGGDSSDGAHAVAFYEKLEKTVLPLFHTDRSGWCAVMKQAIATSAWQFSGNRMLDQYAEEAYGFTAPAVAAPPATG